MKKILCLLATLCFLASYQLSAMDNNAEQGEMARRERQTQAAASLIRGTVITTAAVVAHYFFARFIHSLQGWQKFLGNVAWLGTASITTTLNTAVFNTFAQNTFARNDILAVPFFWSSLVTGVPICMIKELAHPKGLEFGMLDFVNDTSFKSFIRPIWQALLVTFAALKLGRAYNPGMFR